jgi:hypothetical protein
MNNNIYLVKNRSTSTVVYSIPEDGTRRVFQPSEVKKISGNELEKLSYLPGGRSLIANFLQITNEDFISDLGIHTELEYSYSEEDIKNLLLYGSLDELLDCLDYAPLGVIDLVKQIAVSLPLNDLNKRKAIENKLGFSVEKALQHIEEDKRAEADSKNDASSKIAPAVAPATGRRVQKDKPVVNQVADIFNEVIEQPVVTTSKYKVVSKK